MNCNISNLVNKVIELADTDAGYDIQQYFIISPEEFISLYEYIDDNFYNTSVERFIGGFKFCTTINKCWIRDREKASIYIVPNCQINRDRENIIGCSSSVAEELNIENNILEIIVDEKN